MSICYARCAVGDDSLTTDKLNNFVVMFNLIIEQSKYPLFSIEVNKTILLSQAKKLRKDLSFYATLTNTFTSKQIGEIETIVVTLDNIIK